MAVKTKQELLDRLKYLAEGMERIFNEAAKKQAEIRGGIRKLEKKLK